MAYFFCFKLTAMQHMDEGKWGFVLIYYTPNGSIVITYMIFYLPSIVIEYWARMIAASFHLASVTVFNKLSILCNGIMSCLAVKEQKSTFKW